MGISEFEFYTFLSFIAFRILIKSLPKMQEMAFSETLDFKISQGKTPEPHPPPPHTHTQNGQF